ncbi:MAG: DUF1214 domain-containing protein [Gammaproteobacteria bacterium]|nr:DUF1214 domain-containing protein [Gammaproteobacteria bacterium]MBK9665230.1 DUF1214 domain-containing protein [Gammaproteobacteria bacterium]
MLPGMKTNKDESLATHIRKDSPGKDKEANWLPAPDGTACLVMRLHCQNRRFVAFPSGMQCAV